MTIIEDANSGALNVMLTLAELLKKLQGPFVINETQPLGSASIVFRGMTTRYGVPISDRGGTIQVAKTCTKILSHGVGGEPNRSCSAGLEKMLGLLARVPTMA